MLSNIPPFFDMIYTDKEGNLTPNSLLFNDETNKALRYLITAFNELVITSFSNTTGLYTNKGLMVPNATTAEVTVYQDDLDVPVGTMWFTTDLAPNPKLQVKTVQAVYDINGVLVTPGVIETITSV